MKQTYIDERGKKHTWDGDGDGDAGSPLLLPLHSDKNLVINVLDKTNNSPSMIPEEHRAFQAYTNLKRKPISWPSAIGAIGFAIVMNVLCVGLVALAAFLVVFSAPCAPLALFVGIIVLIVVAVNTFSMAYDALRPEYTQEERKGFEATLRQYVEKQPDVDQVSPSPSPADSENKEALANNNTLNSMGTCQQERHHQLGFFNSLSCQNGGKASEKKSDDIPLMSLSFRK